MKPTYPWLVVPIMQIFYYVLLRNATIWICSGMQPVSPKIFKKGATLSLLNCNTMCIYICRSFAKNARPNSKSTLILSKFYFNSVTQKWILCLFISLGVNHLVIRVGLWSIALAIFLARGEVSIFFHSKHLDYISIQSVH